MLQPTEVQAPKGAREMRVRWEDGSETAYRHEVLRGFCPCAECQGHQGALEWVEAKETDTDTRLELADIDEVGNYALALSWADGHRTGIYSFTFLRELAPLFEMTPQEVRAHVFPR